MISFSILKKNVSFFDVLNIRTNYGSSIKGKCFSSTRILTCILVHNLAGYLREHSVFDVKSLYQRSNQMYAILYMEGNEGHYTPKYLKAIFHRVCSLLCVGN